MNNRSEHPKKTTLKELTYSPKILIAWKQAIAGDKRIRNWLTENGYKELGIFCYALKNDFKAKDWLFKNGYPHLLALINAAEGGDSSAVDGFAVADYLRKNEKDIFETLVSVPLKFKDKDYTQESIRGFHAPAIS